MIRTHLIAAIILMLCGWAVAREAGTVIALGAWSAAALDEGTGSLRGRLVVVERPIVVGGRDGFPRQERREVVVFLELQDARDALPGELRVFCDLGRTDFRPEYKGGLRCELFDRGKRPVPTEPGLFGGGRPGSQWVTIPQGGAVRLRTTPWGIHHENAMAISLGLNATWVVRDDDAKEYFLGGTFTADKDADGKGNEPDDRNIWRGTVQLPPVRIASPAAVDPVAGLVAKLAASHGLWLNGMFPQLDAPADAPAEQVLAEVFEKTTPPEGKVTTFEVLEEREVTIPIVADRRPGPQEQYTAVRVKTNVGDKIVLLQRSGAGWWSRVYGVGE